MQRIKEQFLEKLESTISLRDKKVLEIGCGEGVRSEQIAMQCGSLVGIDPSAENINVVRKKNIHNGAFEEGRAEELRFADKNFDVVIFTLSLHHVSEPLMEQAIKEAVRVVTKRGFIVFLEPGMNGSFFEAEIQFDACDGDESKEKESAYRAMMKHSQLKLIKEIPDETVFKFDSEEDFITSMAPKKDRAELSAFLQKYNYILTAERRINIFQPVIWVYE